MNTVRWVQTHRRSILFLVLALGLAGLASSYNLPVSLFPHVSFPRIQVGIEAGNRPVDHMAIEVTRLVEEAVRAVPGVRHVRSSTSRGSAEVSITFGWGDDMVSAMLQIESAINQVRGSLPPNTVIEVRRMDPTVFPILGRLLELQCARAVPAGGDIGRTDDPSGRHGEQPAQRGARSDPFSRRG